jgi:hypothetical protein
MECIGRQQMLSTNISQGKSLESFLMLYEHFLHHTGMGSFSKVQARVENDGAAGNFSKMDQGFLSLYLLV